MSKGHPYILEISQEMWMAIAGDYPHQTSLRDTIQILLLLWCKAKGLKGGFVRIYMTHLISHTGIPP
jgi:hypothetical protein